MCNKNRSGIGSAPKIITRYYASVTVTVIESTTVFVSLPTEIFVVPGVNAVTNPVVLTVATSAAVEE